MVEDVHVEVAGRWKGSRWRRVNFDAARFSRARRVSLGHITSHLTIPADHLQWTLSIRSLDSKKEFQHDEEVAFFSSYMTERQPGHTGAARTSSDYSQRASASCPSRRGSSTFLAACYEL